MMDTIQTNSIMARIRTLSNVIQGGIYYEPRTVELVALEFASLVRRLDDSIREGGPLPYEWAEAQDASTSIELGLTQ
jgi:hypothetical protein